VSAVSKGHTAHSRAVLSAEAVIRAPSGLNAALVTESMCPRSTVSEAPVSASHNRPALRQARLLSRAWGETFRQAGGPSTFGSTTASTTMPLPVQSLLNRPTSSPRESSAARQPNRIRAIAGSTDQHGETSMPKRRSRAQTLGATIIRAAAGSHQRIGNGLCSRKWRLAKPVPRTCQERQHLLFTRPVPGDRQAIAVQVHVAAQQHTLRLG
jgi:hypothetical protein